MANQTETVVSVDSPAMQEEAVLGPTVDMAPPSRDLIADLGRIETEMNLRIYERADVVRSAWVALLTGHHMLQVGPPGTAKSELLTLLARYIRPEHGSGSGLRLFKTLLTKFSVPEELKGPIDVEALANGRFQHDMVDSLADCHVAFLEEIFNGSSAILNTLLLAINEREVKNGRQLLEIPLISIFGATNHLPEGSELEAFFDRFALRHQIMPLSDQGRGKLIEQVVMEQRHRLMALHARANNLPEPGGFSPIATMTLGDLMALQAAVRTVEVPPRIQGMLVQLGVEMAKAGMTVSDRRWAWLPSLLQANALVEGRMEVDDADTVLLQHILWTDPSHRAVIAKTVAHMANPLDAQAQDRLQQAQTIWEQIRTVKASSVSDQDKSVAIMDGFAKMRQMLQNLERMNKQAIDQGRKNGVVAKALAQVKEWNDASLNFLDEAVDTAPAAPVGA